MNKSLMSLVFAASISTIATAPAAAVTVSLVPLASTTHTVAAMTDLTCAVPNADASIVGRPFMQIPSIAEGQNAVGTSSVQIALLPNGTLGHASLVTSSGNSYLDHAALQSAHMTQFRAETQGCAKVAGTYLYTVEF